MVAFFKSPTNGSKNKSLLSYSLSLLFIIVIFTVSGYSVGKKNKLKSHFYQTLFVSMRLKSQLDDFRFGAKLFKSISNTDTESAAVITSIISMLITAQVDGYLGGIVIRRLVFLNAYPCRPP